MEAKKELQPRVAHPVIAPRSNIAIRATTQAREQLCQWKRPGQAIARRGHLCPRFRCRRQTGSSHEDLHTHLRRANH